MDRTPQTEAALELLLLAYANSDERFGCPGVEWEDLDAAFEAAREVMPDVYERLVNTLELETEE